MEHLEILSLHHAGGQNYVFLRKLGVPLAFCLQTLALLLAGCVTSYK